MFDPHRTRHNDRRYYTKKGQVIQARSISAPFNIDRSKVDAYKEYIIKNNLISVAPPPPPPSTTITIDAVSTSAHPGESFPTNQFAYTAEGGVVDMSSFTAPRVLIAIKERANDYLIIIFMVANYTSLPVDPGTCYVVFSVGQYSDYDIKFLSGGQSVISVQDQVGDPDNTTFLLSKSMYSISLPA